MGILYSSAIAYIYGDYGQKKLSEVKIILTISKLIKQLRKRQQKLQLQTKNVQKVLLNMINNQNKLFRNVQAQIQLCKEILIKGELFVAYEQVINCSNIIKNEAKLLEEGIKVSQKCLIAICTILYCYKHLNLEQFVKLEEIFPKPYPQINVEQISESLKLYVNRKQMSYYEINLYILQMCYRNQLTLQKVNEAGHHFVYNPHNFDQTKSSQMFAMSFEQLKDEQFMSEN